MDFCERTKELFDLYFKGTCREDAEKLIASMTSDCVIIGTGEREIFRTGKEIREDILNAVTEHTDFTFSIDDMQVYDRTVTPQVHLVYGRMSIQGACRNEKDVVSMDSRFSMLYELEDGQWKISSLHQSVPFNDPSSGKSYPRRLYNQLEEIKTMADGLKELAQKDSLTGLYNLRTLQELYETASRKNAWILMGDLDNFKNINDVYGHLEGNNVLMKVADSLRACVRSQDVVARIGGDEFVILCQDLAESQVKDVLDRILRSIEKIQEDMAAEMNASVDFGISVGAVLVRQGETLPDALRRADSKMYSAKKSGKNRFCMAEEN